jgi:hypothetical protein
MGGSIGMALKGILEYTSSWYQISSKSLFLVTSHVLFSIIYFNIFKEQSPSAAFISSFTKQSTETNLRLFLQFNERISFPSLCRKSLRFSSCECHGILHYSNKAAVRLAILVVFEIILVIMKFTESIAAIYIMSRTSTSCCVSNFENLNEDDCNNNDHDNDENMEDKKTRRY